jgi:hypothetical protein
MEVLLFVAQDLRKLAQAVELRIILAHTYCQAGRAIVFSCVVGA